MNGQQQPNGYGPHGNGVPGPVPSGSGLHVPSVRDALTYTPFSSVFPFSPGRCIFTLSYIASYCSADRAKHLGMLTSTARCNTTATCFTDNISIRIWRIPRSFERQKNA